MSVADLSLSHFTDADAVAPHSTAQDDSWAKPNGLWVSVDGEDDWASWCESEEYGIGRNRFAVTLAAASDVLVLATPGEVIEFGREYQLDTYRLEWSRVAEKHAGIIIAPYQWSLRLSRETSWYYPWDCASGCIWDATAIESVTQ